jgi:hypothetical protein
LIDRRLNPDWYRVRYNLAALHATWSASLSAEPESESEATDHRSTAHTLSGQVAKSALEQALDRPAETDAPLKSMLETSILPSALLIYAATGSSTTVKPAQPFDNLSVGDRRSEQRKLLIGLKREDLDETAAAQYAISHTRPTPKFLYNLACLYAQTAAPGMAARELRAMVQTSSGKEREELGERASKDPSLHPFRTWADGDGHQMKQLLSGLSNETAKAVAATLHTLAQKELGTKDEAENGGRGTEAPDA